MARTRSANRAVGNGPARGPAHHRSSNRYPKRQSHASQSQTRSSDLSDESTMYDVDSESASSDTAESEFEAAPRPKQRPQRSVGKAASGRPARSRNSAALPKIKRPMPSRVTKPTKPDSRSKARTGPHRRRAPLGRPERHHGDAAVATLHKAAEKPEKLPAAPKTPNWLDPRITYDCWVSIFLYAGSEGSTDCPATNWLVQAATSCKAFTEPALTAIYRCPLIRTPTKAKRLAALLARDPTKTLFNYRAKVEYLDIDIHIVPQAVLYQLIHPLFRLKELVVFTPMDQPPYRKLDTNVRWHYPEDIFKALLPSPEQPGSVAEKPFPTVLKSWEWSGRLIGGHVATVDDLCRIHQTPSFAHLTRVSFTNFQVPSLQDLAAKDDDDDNDSQSYHEDGLVINAVASAISELKFLRHLVFESSTVMNSRLLPLLPRNLHHLELINCWEIRSEDLAPFLNTHGSQLRTLTLLHNQSLNLAFLTTLADACPQLRVLHMNLTYYRHHDTVNDSDPMYDFSLLPSQVPQWPSSLRVVNIDNIRNWSQATAEMFLQSIRASHARLPHLRYLGIKTSLDIPWQARAELRSRWRLEMERVFLRPFIPPTTGASLATTADEKPSRKRKRPSRRSGRIAGIADSQQSRGSLRSRRRPQYREPDTDEDEFDMSEEEEEEEEESGSEGSSDAAETTHGLCNTVSIIFDNQKPTELQYGMEDFLDNEESEEEWNGDEDDEDDPVLYF